MTGLGVVGFALFLGSAVALLFAAWRASDLLGDRRLAALGFAGIFVIPVVVTLLASAFSAWATPEDGPRPWWHLVSGLRSFLFNLPFVAIIFVIARRARRDA